jgi:hypothetical protein
MFGPLLRALLGPASLGPASLGPASLGPASLGPASLDPASLGLALDLLPDRAGRPATRRSLARAGAASTICLSWKRRVTSSSSMSSTV